MASKSIPTIGTLATGISYLGMPFTNAICMRWPQHQRLLCITGFAICVVSLIAASFATATWQLLLSQGALYGAGWVICYTPFLFMLNEWFVEKRGLAYGILFAASGVSGLIIPLAVGAIMDRFGFRTALRVFAVATLIIGGPGLFMIKPRTAYARSPGQGNEKLGHSTEVMAVLKSTHFLIFAAAIFLQGLGFFLPNVFLPSFASDLGLPSSAGSALLASISISQVVGQIGLGHVSDKMNPYIPTSFASCVSGLAVLFLWAPAKGMVKLVPFALLWGLFSASYSVLYTRVCSSLVEDADVSMTVYGIFSFERGVANILEGPISAFLLGDEVDVDTYALGKYQGVAWFTGVCMLLSSFAVVGMLQAIHRR
ncbi:hypothetical protein M8818_005585 [Zalaria obscura]|uniref:Uncharacterized protein n=1 Tax=Zalaria obscura TaxID=2024903 RepID=A0ACC3SBH2_9PEZI